MYCCANFFRSCLRTDIFQCTFFNRVNDMLHSVSQRRSLRNCSKWYAWTVRSRNVSQKSNWVVTHELKLVWLFLDFFNEIGIVLLGLFVIHKEGIFNSADAVTPLNYLYTHLNRYNLLDRPLCASASLKMGNLLLSKTQLFHIVSRKYRILTDSAYNHWSNCSLFLDFMVRFDIGNFVEW